MAKRRVLQDSKDTLVLDFSTKELCQDDHKDRVKDIGNRCLVCYEFGRNNERWYRCTSCGLWVHAECIGWDSAEGYFCVAC